MSDFGADKSIDYRTFSENLSDRGINVSPLLAKQLFGIYLYDISTFDINIDDYI